MKKIFVFLTLTTLISGCSNLTEKTSSFDSSNSPTSKSSTDVIESQKSLLTEEIREYYWYKLSDYVQIFCWRIDDTHWNCGASGFGRNSGSSFHVTYFEQIQKFMYEIPLTLPDMALLLEQRSSAIIDDEIKVYEIPYGCSKNEYNDYVVYDCKNHLSINKTLYEELGLLDLYIDNFGEIDNPELTDAFEYDISSVEWIKVYQYYTQVSSESNVLYCWKSNDSEWRCGLNINGSEITNFEEYQVIQNVGSCPLKTMARILHRISKIKISGICIFEGNLNHEQFDAWLKNDKKTYANDKYLYLKTDTYDVYKNLFEVADNE